LGFFDLTFSLLLFYHFACNLDSNGWCMRKVSVENIDPDMVLARDVASTSGNVLLGKGTALTPAMGRRLKNWGIFFVYIEGEEESEEQAAAVEISPDSPIMEKIFNAVFEFKISKRNG